MACERKNILFVSVALGLIFLDQLSKYLIRHSGGFYICNPNIAFSIQVPSAVFYIFWICVVLFVIILANPKLKITNPKQYPNQKLINPKPFWISNFDNWNLFRIWNLGFRIFDVSSFGIILALSGAVSNIIDRLYFDCIIDFIDLKFWPIFNLADSFIVIGAILLIIRTTDSH